MTDQAPQLPISPQEVQIEPPSFWDKLKIHRFKILAGVLGVLVFTGAVFGAYKFGQRRVQPSPQPTPTPIVEATPTPESKTTYPKYGYAPDFSWVAGLVKWNPLEGGCWILSFFETPEEADVYNGILALVVPVHLKGKLQSGSFVVVTGKVIGNEFSMACPPTVYETETIQLNKTSTIDSTANWKTYTNTKYNFTLKYPPDFSFSEESLKELKQDQPSSIIFSKRNDLDYPIIVIALRKTSLTPTEWANSNRCNPLPAGDILCTPYKQGPIPGSIRFQSIEIVHYQSAETVLKHNDILFDISLNSKLPSTPLPNDALDFYNQILSTLKFLE